MKFVLLILTFCGYATCLQPRVIVEHGELAGTSYPLPNGRNVHAFLGIPYAIPPVHKYRFKVCYHFINHIQKHSKNFAPTQKLYNFVKMRVSKNYVETNSLENFTQNIFVLIVFFEKMLFFRVFNDKRDFETLNYSNREAIGVGAVVFWRYKLNNFPTSNLMQRFFHFPLLFLSNFPELQGLFKKKTACVLGRTIEVKLLTLLANFIE